MGHTRDDALALDAADPLGHWRNEFLIAEPDLVYLDGNSLGRTPKRTVARIREVIEQEWGVDLIRSWSHWLDKPQRVGDLLAPLIGAGPGEVVVHDSTTVNLYQLLHGAAALRPERRVLAIDEHDFPSDRYVVDGIAQATGRTVRHGFDQLDDVAVARPRGLPPAPRADQVGCLTPWQHVADFGDAAGWAAVHGQ
jgi:kynureninase